MRIATRRAAALLLVAFLVVPLGSSSAQSAADFRQVPSADWPSVGGNWANQRYSSLDQINASNVKRLKGAWMARLNGSGMDTKYSQQGTPVVRDGMMFMPTGQQDIFALDLKTGNIAWSYISDVDPKSPGGWRNRGVAVADGKVFTIQKDARVLALDEKTGKSVWETQIGTDLGAKSPKYSSNAIIYYDGLLYTGISGGDSGVRGRLTALDAATGKIAWEFFIAPAPGQFGNETWEGDSWQFGGGAGWMHPALDPELNMVYLPTGNAWPDTDGGVRGGDNLFTASIVALDAKTGQYRWHFQEVHHEIWDYDNANSPVLFDVSLNGVMRKALAHTGKTGMTYLLDRTNGEPLIGIEERPVKQDPAQKTSLTQPFPIGDAFVPQCAHDAVPGYAVGCIFDPPAQNPVLLAPGPLGGNDYSPISFNQKTGLLYVGASDINYAFGLAHEKIDPLTGEKTKLDGIGFFLPNGTKRSGNITAIDPTTNKIVWQKPNVWPKGMGSGIMSTAGGLLFSGDPDGNFVAYDANTGDELWRFQTGFGADAPAITYMLNGEQYVAIATGGNVLAYSAPGDAVWAFKLDGNVGSLNAPKAPPTVGAITGVPVVADTVSIGRNWNADLKQANVVNEYAFGPDNISVPVGTSVTWTNQGDVQHTASSDSGLFDSGLLSNGDSFSYTFSSPGTYNYFCTPHSWMLGQVTVK